MYFCKYTYANAQETEQLLLERTDGVGGGKGRDGHETPIFLLFILKFRVHPYAADARYLQILHLQIEPTTAAYLEPPHRQPGTPTVLRGHDARAEGHRRESPDTHFWFESNQGSALCLISALPQWTRVSLCSVLSIPVLPVGDSAV